MMFGEESPRRPAVEDWPRLFASEEAAVNQGDTVEDDAESVWISSIIRHQGAGVVGDRQSSRDGNAPSDWMTLQDVAAYVRSSRQTVYRLMNVSVR